jgi:tetratricopeptide (TPR) repeat protein
MLVDHHLNERNYDAAHRALDRLSEYTGGDAAIKLLKANVYLTEKNYIEAIRYSRMAIMEDSSLEDAYWTLLAVSIHADHYEIAVETLRHLERQFGHAFDPDQIANIKGYEKFASSSIFSDWKYGMIP